MRNLILIICSCIGTNLLAQDSLKSIKKNSKWSLSFTIDNNYNYRYVRKPNFLEYGYPTNYDYTQKDWDYLDSCNIACKMKSISIKVERKIWKFISIQSGLTYGRKGYMGCRSVTFNDIGYSRLYYTNIPFLNLVLPIGFSFNKRILNNKIILSANSGLEFNYGLKGYDRYQNKGYLEKEKRGFFGFENLKKVNNQIAYEPNEPGTVSFAQYYLGFNIKYKIFNSTYITVEYNYVSDFKFYEVTEYLHVRTYAYERKSYIHRYGGGIGFMF